MLELGLKPWAQSFWSVLWEEPAVLWPSGCPSWRTTSRRGPGPWDPFGEDQKKGCPGPWRLSCHVAQSQRHRGGRKLCPVEVPLKVGDGQGARPERQFFSLTFTSLVPAQPEEAVNRAPTCVGFSSFGEKAQTSALIIYQASPKIGKAE